MKKKLFRQSIAIVIILVVSLPICSGAQAGNKSMEAAKRTIYQNDSTESMYEADLKREAEEKEYKAKVLSNGEESVKLLKEIRDLLQQLNEKE